jgi:hypothetical protein
MILRMHKLAVSLVLLAAACSSQETAFNRQPEMWPAGPDAPLSGLFSDYGLKDFNPWTGEASWAWEADSPVVKNDRLGFFAVANGRTFGFVGTDYPLSVLHEAYGPDYDRPDLKSFQDIVFTAYVGGAQARLRKSRIGRFAAGGAVGVVSEAAGIKMTSLFAAPSTAAGPFSTSIIVATRVENTGKTVLTDLDVAAVPFAGAADSGTQGVMIVKEGNRRIYAVLDGGLWDSGRQGLASGSVKLGPGEKKDAVFALFFTKGDAAVDPAPGFLSALQGADIKALFSETSQFWNGWFKKGLQAEIPDPRVSGLLESFLYTIISQTQANGAMTPLSHYGEFWTRDLSGAVRMLEAASRTDDVRRVLDYHYAAACSKKGFFNAGKVLYPVGVPCAVADWSVLPVMKDKTAAEAPSYVPHMYHRLFDATGDLSLVQERLPMLRYALEKQAFTPEYLLPFSDDETFRGALAMNTGIGGPDMTWHDKAWSLQSSLLFLAASDGLVRALGLPASDNIAVLRDKVLAALNKYYWNDAKGVFAPFVYFDGFTPYLHPYEDVNLTAEWMNLEGLLGEDRLKRDLDALISESWKAGKGIIQTWRGQPVEILWYKITEGIFTGMTPGFSLYALARHRPDIAEKAFNSFPTFVTPSGNVTEDFSTADLIPLMPLYDKAGDMSEVWARFRLWEGGQDGEAILFYLTGLEPDAASKSVKLAPRLPNNWPSASYKGLLAAGCLIDMTVAERSDYTRDHTLTFTGAACDGLKVTFRAASWSCGERDFCKPNVAVKSGNAAVTTGSEGSATFTAAAGKEYFVTAKAR